MSILLVVVLVLFSYSYLAIVYWGYANFPQTFVIIVRKSD